MKLLNKESEIITRIMDLKNARYLIEKPADLRGCLVNHFRSRGWPQAQAGARGLALYGKGLSLYSWVSF